MHSSVNWVMATAMVAVRNKVQVQRGREDLAFFPEVVGQRIAFWERHTSRCLRKVLI